MNIDYNAVIEVLKSFLNNEKIEILGISVGEERQVREAIKNLLTAYEKEKEKNKEILSGNIESFQKYFLEEFNKKFISIDKLKEIVDECIPKKENIITKELEYTPNANANSYLTQEILSLLKEE